jgi:hypothetical protein
MIPALMIGGLIILGLLIVAFAIRWFAETCLHEEFPAWDGKSILDLLSEEADSRYRKVMLK